MKLSALKTQADTAGLVGMGLITTCALLRCSPSTKLSSISVSLFVPERVREQEAAQKQAAHARRVNGQQRIHVQVFINCLGSRRRQSDVQNPARVAPEEVLQSLAAGGGVWLLPEGCGELPLVHRDPPRVQTHVSHAMESYPQRVQQAPCCCFCAAPWRSCARSA